MENKRICLIAPSREMGGIERMMSILASHFVNRGFEVWYISCRRGRHFYELDPRVRFAEPDFTHTTSRVKKLPSYLRTIRFIRRKLKEIRPLTILSLGDIINPIAIIANLGTGFPLYISDRISPRQPLSRFKNTMKRLTYRHATGIIAQSKAAADYKVQMFGPGLNIRIIPNSLRPIEDCRGVERQNIVIGVGRLSIEKGFDRLIEAFARIEGHDDWRLRLVGDGPMTTELKQQAERLGISRRTEFSGRRTDVDRLLAESRIFVIPSRCEGFPNALCEAMASPLPCIAFDSIAAEEIMERGVSGVVVPDGDIEGMAHEISTLMSSAALRERYAAEAVKIRKTLAPERIGDEFLRFITHYE